MNFPENLKYTKDHEWVRLEGNVAYVGITDFAQSELGDIVFVDISSQGKSFSHGEIFGTVEAVKTVSDLYMPLSGEVAEVNAKLDSNPDLINSDPYGNGWMIKINLSNAGEIDALMDSAAYSASVGA